MFGTKKKAIQLTVVDKPKTKKADNAAPGEDKVIHPDSVKLIAEQGKIVVGYVALAAIGVYAAVKTIDTVSQIAIKKTKSADND